MHSHEKIGTRNVYLPGLERDISSNTREFTLLAGLGGYKDDFEDVTESKL